MQAKRGRYRPTLNHMWGYRTDDQDWTSAGDVVFTLVEIVSKGGTDLLTTARCRRRRRTSFTQRAPG